MLKTQTTLVPGLLLALAGGAFAQNGTDTCTTPTPIGEGSFAFDTTTMVGSSEMVCTSAYDMNQDMFWVYTSTITGDVQIDTEGSSFDTQLGIFSGTDCTATCIVDDDDSGTGLLSRVILTGVTAGDTFVIQSGGFGVGAGLGILNIAAYVDPCIGTPADAFEDNDTCASPAVITAGSYTSLTVTLSDPDYYSIDVPAGDILTLTETFDSNDCDYTFYDLGCGIELAPAALTGNTWTNNTGSTQTVIIYAHQWSGADPLCSDYEFDLTITADPCASVTPDALEDNDTCATPVVLATGSYIGLNVQDADPDYYSIDVPAGDILTLTETFDSNDTDYIFYDVGCGIELAPLGLDGNTWTNSTGSMQTVIIYAHQWNGAALLCSDYDFDLSLMPDPCQSATDDSFEDNDDCATATPLADGLYTGLFSSRTDKDHYSFCVPAGSTVTIDVLFNSAVGDLDAFLWEAVDPNCGSGMAFSTELALGFSLTDNENLVWTNPLSSDVDVVLEVNTWDSDSNTGNCNDYDLQIIGSGCAPTSDGTPFCDPMDVNSTGLSTTMVGFLGTGVESGLRLEASNGVPGEFGYFLIGTGVNDPGIVISDGRLCLAVTGGNQFGRYNFGTTTNSIGQFDAAGDFQNLLGTATSNGGYGYDVALANPLGGMIMSGETWNFQLWHRDTPSGVGRSNFSNGLTVMFP